MIDETLSRLSRALIVASDKLASEDFLTRQARFVEIEAERAALAESLEADEAAVVAAQEALQAHFRGSDGDGMGLTKGAQWTGEELCALTEGEPEPAEINKIEVLHHDVVDVEKYFRPIFGPTEVDEFSSSRANGAYTED